MCGSPDILANAGAGFAVGGVTYSGLTARAGAKAQAQIARNNETVILANAENEATRRGVIASKAALDESRVRQLVDRTIGAQRAHYGATNLDADTGSPLLLALSAAAQGELDVNLIHAQRLLDEGESRGREASLIQGAAGENFRAASLDAKAEETLIATAFGAGAAYLNTATKWAALQPKAFNPNVNRYALGTGKAGG